MLYELRDVEVYIEPDEVLTKALEEGDLTIDTMVRECISEDGVDSVLDAVDNSDITDYCERLELIPEINFQQISSTLHRLDQNEKAKLMWLLLTTAKETL